ncbi:Polycomb group protein VERNALIZATION 2, partial [Mucuna pruriens]
LSLSKSEPQGAFYVLLPNELFYLPNNRIHNEFFSLYSPVLLGEILARVTSTASHHQYQFNALSLRATSTASHFFEVSTPFILKYCSTLLIHPDALSFKKIKISSYFPPLSCSGGRLPCDEPLQSLISDLRGSTSCMPGSDADHQQNVMCSYRHWSKAETKHLEYVIEFPSSFEISRPRKRRRKDSVQNEKRASVKFLEMDSPEGMQNGFLQKDDDILSCKGENVSRTSYNEKIFPSGRNDGGKFGPNHPGTTDDLEHVESSFNIPGVSIAMPQSSGDPECSKSVYKSDPALPAKTKKLSMDRSDSRNRMLLQKRQFFHSHRVQPMALEQVLSDRDSEDEVDDDIADLEDRRMLDDFVDVSKDEKQLMHLWNSFMRKQRVLADGHVAWACEAFSKLHGKELISSPALFWCWRLFMIKLWNHGLLDACTMNNCSIILDNYRNEGLDTGKN